MIEEGRSTAMPGEEQEQPAPMRWEFDADTPTSDFFDSRPLTEIWNLQEAVEDFDDMLERKEFLTWEAVVREEQGLPLTVEQAEGLSGLISFGDTAGDRILYINEIARPSEPWHVILNKIAPHLLVEPYKTAEVAYEVKLDGWRRIMAALREHGRGLSLPPGVASHEEVVPAELRHKLWLQDCYNALSGLGQDEDLTLEVPEEHYRIDEFIKALRECRESVAHFGLTVESLLTRVILPERDRPSFVRMMQEKLGLRSVAEPIVDHLKPGG
jgi:hypothetical protein